MSRIRSPWIVLATVSLMGLLGCTGSSSPGGNLTIRNYAAGPTQVPSPWIAVRDGDGPWIKPSGSGGEYQVTITDPAGRYSVICLASSTPATLHLVNATLAELPVLSTISGDPGTPPATHAVSSHVDGLATGQAAEVRLGFAGVTVYDASTYSFPTPSGTFDLAAGRYPSASEAIDRVILKRGVTVTDTTSTLPSMDFATEGFALAPVTATLQNFGASDQIRLWAGFSAGTALDFGAISDSSFSFNAVPAANQIGTDYNFVAGSAQSGPRESRTKGVSFKAPGAQTITLPDPITVTGPAFTASATPLLSLSWSAAPWADLYNIRFDQGDPLTIRTWQVHTTPGWMGSSMTYTLPDGATIPGFDPNWSLTQAPTISWYFNAAASNAPLAPILQVSPSLVPNYTWTRASRSGALVP